MTHILRRRRSHNNPEGRPSMGESPPLRARRNFSYVTDKDGALRLFRTPDGKQTPVMQWESVAYIERDDVYFAYNHVVQAFPDEFVGDSQ